MQILKNLQRHTYALSTTQPYGLNNRRNGKKSFMLLKTLSLFLALCLGSSVFAQTDFFTQPAAGNLPAARAATNNVKNKLVVQLNESAMRNYLLTAPMEFRNNGVTVPLGIPMPNGETETFDMVESPVLAPAIAAAHPEIKTYTGNGRKNHRSVIRLSLTPSGFSAIILDGTGNAVYFEPFSKQRSDTYFTYYSKDAMGPNGVPSKGGSCGQDLLPPGKTLRQPLTAGTNAARLTTGNTLTTFRLAMAADAEFVAQNGGTQASGFNAVVAYVDRIKAFYRTELSVDFTLVSGTNLIYTNAATDPYTNNNQGAMLDQNKNNCNAVIGVANYDIGHVWGTAGGSGGGVASLESVCDDDYKGRGVSGEGDLADYAQVFMDQLIFHEMGHQLGMTHSYNSSIPVCTTREPGTSVEPGAGATIMSYGFTCDTDDYFTTSAPQTGPILQLHTANFSQSLAFIATTACGIVTTVANSAPVVTVPPNYTIPRSTPFYLTGSATDADNDPLTYCWEGTNVGTMVPDATTLANTAQPPFFRSYAPTTSPTRIYPLLDNILDGSNYAKGDKLPSVGIATTHRLTARDNYSVSGGVSFGTVTVTVDGAIGPFLVTSNLAASYPANSSQTVTWSVNGTNAATPNVKISLSTDGGYTWPTVLLASTPNDGSQAVTLPNIATTTARLKVEAVGNIFFDISNSDFTITQPPPSVFPGGVSANIKLWLKANTGVISSGGVVSSWLDQSGGGFNATQPTAARQPGLTTVSPLFNNNTTINFDLVDDGMITAASITARPYSFFVVYNSTNNSTAARRGVQGSNNWLIGPYANRAQFFAGAFIAPNTITPTTSPNISTGTATTAATNNAAFYYNGRTVTAAATGTASPGTIFLGAAGLGVEPMGGSIAEVIAYTNVLSPAERNKVESYLAIKYGVSMDQTVATNLTSATGTVVWNAASNVGYTNNIFGIGQDDGSGLSQLRSTSNNTSRISISNASALVTGDYLVISDNNLSATPVAQGGLPGGATLGTPLIWNANKTGTVDTVTLTIQTALQDAILLVDNDNNGSFETAVTAATLSFNGITYTNTYNGVSLNHLAKFKIGYKALPTQSSNVSITPIVTPALTACGGGKTFTVRVRNLTGTVINNLLFRDSMPPNINYIAGSVTGTGVAFSGTETIDNVVVFSIATIPGNGFIDVSWDAAANCAVSTDPTKITNTYKVTWSTFFTAPFTTATYSVLFPSLSITPATPGTFNAFCLTPFVRDITICNGGFGSVDSVTFTDVESNNSLIIRGFSNGTQTGLGTNSAKTVLKAADFMTVGNGDGKLDQNECIILHDTLMVVGSVGPITGTLLATWGCYANVCNNPLSNTFTLNTTISAASPLQPSLTRTLYPQITDDSSGQIYGRTNTYREVVKNNSSVTAVGARLFFMATGLKYFNTGSFAISRNGGAPVPITANIFNTAQTPRNNPTGQMGTIIAPAAFPGYDQPNSVYVALGDIMPGDSVDVTFTATTAGPVTRVNDNCCANNTGNNEFCGWFYRFIDGPSIGSVLNAQLDWQGCPSGTFTQCVATFPATIYNGISKVAEPNGLGPIFLSRFRGYGWIDSTATNRCAYFENDTLRVLLYALTMDIPFYTDKSKLCIKISTTGGVKWDGRLDRTFGRLTNWSNNPWYADRVVDSSAYDSTIRVYFKRSNCPIPNFTTLNGYNSYQAGGWHLAIGLVNTCPGPAQKRIRMTRVYTIDTTNNEPAVESGGTTFPVNQTWNSICAGPCSDGVSILNYEHKRTTFGSPDNNQDGMPDASGSIDLNKVNLNLITWGDTLTVKTKMIVHSTNAGGVPSLYVNSSINYADINAAIICNNFLTKDFPRIVLKRPGVGSFTGVGTSVPVNTNNFFLANISLQGTGGVTIPGITTYLEGDTVELTQNIIYFKPHQGYHEVVWSFLHVPFTANVVNPTIPQRLKCDSVVCDFHTIDMDIAASSSGIASFSCADSMILRYGLRAQIANSGCGSDYFPFESRNVYTPTQGTIAFPAALGFSFVRAKVYWNRQIKGTTQCAQVISGIYLTPSQYTLANDTLYLDWRQIAASLGQDYTKNNLYSIYQIDFTVKYNPFSSLSGCAKDHSFVQTGFPISYRFESSRPLDTTGVYIPVLKGAGGTVAGALGLPGSNGNVVTYPLGASVTVVKNKVVIRARYNISNPQINLNNDFNWMYVPNRPGITVDSVKVVSTGALVAESVAGNHLYKLGVIGANTAVKDYDVYTTVSLCANDTLKIYADRNPCSAAYPTSWAGYTCQANANVSSYRYITFAGELQMVDSLHRTQKDMCAQDTVQFKVVNSQTQTASLIKIGFKLPFAMSLVPGTTQIKYGNGAWVTATDPVLNAGKYTFSQPVADTLAPVNKSPDNLMYVRCGITTTCGYVSGSQIQSTINGNVACGAVTSLFNTNPPALNINGAPTLSYFTNPKATVTPITDCGIASQYDYRIALTISGGTAGTGDSIKINLSNFYGYVSYNPAQAGSHNAPAAQPIFTTLPDGSAQLSWSLGTPVVAGDSVVFYYKYNDNTPNTNKCAQAPERISTITTYINSSVFCAALGSNCTVSIPNGSDTVQMSSLKPSLAPSTTSITFNSGCGSLGCYGNSVLNIIGSILNTGTAPVTAGTTTVMEVYLDMDNSGSINAGDKAFAPYTTTAAIPMNGGLAFNYTDNTTNKYCLSCEGKNVLIRFSKTPIIAPSVSQCFCDTAVTTSKPVAILLAIKLKEFEAVQQGCEKIALNWKTAEESVRGTSFEIQYSSDGTHFTTLEKVNGSGNLLGSSYSRTLPMSKGIFYYRLLMMDNGHVQYSKVISANNNCGIANNALEVYPNPHDGKSASLFVNLFQIKAGMLRVRVIDARGREVKQMKQDVVAGPSTLQIKDFNQLAAGVYMLIVTNTDGSVSNKKVIRQ